MKTFKKIFKWVGISVGSIIAIFIFLGIILPEPSKTKDEVAVSNSLTAPVVTNPSETQVSLVEEKKTVATETKTVTPKKTTNETPTSTQYKVVSVVDGDTVKVSINGTTETIRIIGLNTPETVDPRKGVECFGKEASNKAKDLLSGKNVTLEVDPSQGERDKYGRLLRYVFLVDGTDFGKSMITNGYAYEYTYNTPYKYQSAYKTAQLQAQANKMGLWANNTCGALSSTKTETTSTTSGNFYTSSYSTSKYYYPADCDGWKSLTPSYLKSFPTLDALLKAYPSRIKGPTCN